MKRTGQWRLLRFVPAANATNSACSSHSNGGRWSFSTRQIIVGRVFVDVNRNGKFDAGDLPLPDVRLFLHSGQSVVTDSQGLYNLPPGRWLPGTLTRPDRNLQSLQSFGWQHHRRPQLGQTTANPSWGGSLERTSRSLCEKMRHLKFQAKNPSGQPLQMYPRHQPSGTSFRVQLATDELRTHRLR